MTTEAYYRPQPLARFPLGRGVELVYLSLKRTGHLLSTSEAEILTGWREFETLSNCADRLNRHQQLTLPSSTLRDRLEKLSALGVLLNRSTVLHSAVTLPSDVHFSGGISWLAIPTRGRPRELRRALRSYLASRRYFGGSTKFLVVGDDHASPDSSLTEQAVSSFKNNRELFYAGRNERRRFAEALSQGGALPIDVVSFAILGSGCRGPTMGATRNTILLATTGARVLCVDDDTICRPGTAPGTAGDGHLSVSGMNDVTEFWFHADRRGAARSVALQELDPVVEHARLLGASVGDAVRLAEGSLLDCGEASAHMLRSLLTGAGRIRVSLNGVVGDSGMYSGAALRVHPGHGTRQRLVSSERSYCIAVNSREVVRQALVTTIASCPQTIGMFIGLDNCDLLPPFLPAYRNEDGLFGLTLDRCCDASYACHLPWVLVHSPAPGRFYEPCGLSKVRVSDILAVCIASWRGGLPGQTPARRMSLLGKHLIELGSMQVQDFNEMLLPLLRRRAFDLMANREDLLVKHAGHPVYWASDVRAQVHSLMQAAADPAYAIPTDMGGEFLAAELPQAIQTLVRRFGELLSWWPALVERATELGATGFEVGRRLS